MKTKMFLSLVTALSGCLCVPGASHGQTTAAPAQNSKTPMPSAPAPPTAGDTKLEANKVEAKLAVKVRLMLGEVSVSAFTEALSKQTGLTITAAPSLRERTVIVQFKEVSALAALSALAELNDWTWRETEPGQIVLRRRVLQVPQEPTFLPRLIQNAIPVDLREYLRVPRPSEDRHVRANPDDRAPMDRTLFNEHVTDAAFGALHDLRSTLSIEDLKKTKLPYAKLTPTQKKLLLASYIYESLQTLHSFLGGDLPAMYQDPGSLRIHFDEKSNNFQGPGFGAYIEPLKEK